MPDLKIDLEQVRAVGTDLGRIAREFESANVRSDRIAEATGHDGLADAVRSFAHSWDDTREDMLESVRGLGEATTAIADVFAETDVELASAIEDAAAATPATPLTPALAGGPA
ncbi:MULTISPECIES: hypothetical protein [unclassified Microbacterium]|uniref:hypothetical protein n=1 Tax=unclassified Microbacterium TaxID=2609290 RepID=UPI00214C8F09|nr:MULTISPECIES: hypothetical protein [unclassified Microbacterium]MCR2799925.1 hypothetical protein [Microbacterium sp. zg.Y818]MCR2825157.1 hypothetical protein [Microbacterium sp. zg.Y909]WIM21904.1 hypothetical protein QNO21_12405 [Microbacterium sp. zg-Y818]